MVPGILVSSLLFLPYPLPERKLQDSHNGNYHSWMTTTQILVLQPDIYAEFHTCRANCFLDLGTLNTNLKLNPNPIP